MDQDLDRVKIPALCSEPAQARCSAPLLRVAVREVAWLGRPLVVCSVV
jgi:hypothetical protein